MPPGVEVALRLCDARLLTLKVDRGIHQEVEAQVARQLGEVVGGEPQFAQSDVVGVCAPDRQCNPVGCGQPAAT